MRIREKARGIPDDWNGLGKFRWESFCEMDCIACGTALQIWLDEEYEEPPKPEVDWDNVPVDTLVRVRDYENARWHLYYYRGFNEELGVYSVWRNGKTSKTADDGWTSWRFCELVEEEEDGSN